MKCNASEASTVIHRPSLKPYMSVATKCCGFPGNTVVKNPPANVEDTGSILGSGRTPEVGNGNPLQCSCLENFMDKGEEPSGL